MVYLIGYMGAGKTTITKSLADELHLPFYDTDQEIEKNQKRSVSEIFKKDGELYFRMLETELLNNINQNSIVYLTFSLNEHIDILNGPKMVELVMFLFTCLLTDRI